MRPCETGCRNLLRQTLPGERGARMLCTRMSKLVRSPFLLQYSYARYWIRSAVPRNSTVSVSDIILLFFLNNVNLIISWARRFVSNTWHSCIGVGKVIGPTLTYEYTAFLHHVPQVRFAAVNCGNRFRKVS